MELLLKPDVLKWARERAGLSASSLALKLKTKTEKVIAWETTGRLRFKDAEKLAQKTYTPFGCLYLTTPPAETLPISDFRTVDDTEIFNPSPDLIETVDTAIIRRDWFRDYQISTGADQVAFVGSITESMTILDAVQKIKASINWDSGVRSSFTKWEDALNSQIDAIEDSGVLVMKNGVVGNNTRRKLDVDEFRGFALSDSFAPLIFINGADSLSAQMFTLAHELVHIFLGLSGVSNLEDTYSNNRSTEQFCNKVAAELLVPESELRSFTPTNLQALCRHFKVSSLVILRRLKDIGSLSVEGFKTAYDKEVERLRVLSEGRTGGSYYRTQATRIGNRFSSALVESTLEGKTSYREAIQLFGTKNVDTFKEYALRLNFSL